MIYELNDDNCKLVEHRDSPVYTIHLSKVQQEQMGLEMHLAKSQPEITIQ